MANKFCHIHEFNFEQVLLVKRYDTDKELYCVQVTFSLSDDLVCDCDFKVSNEDERDRLFDILVSDPSAVAVAVERFKNSLLSSES